MAGMGIKLKRLQRRKRRVRRRVFGTPECPRLSVSRSLRGIAAQIIDDTTGRTLCASGTRTKAFSGQLKSGGNCAAATAIGKHLGEQAVMHGIRKVCFDRNGRKYHGRVKALAEAARKAGLEF